MIVVAMGNAYSLQYFEGIKNILCTYEDNEITQELAPQIIFEPSGRKASCRFRQGKISRRYGH